MNIVNQPNTSILCPYDSTLMLYVGINCAWRGIVKDVVVEANNNTYNCILVELKRKTAKPNPYEKRDVVVIDNKVTARLVYNFEHPLRSQSAAGLMLETPTGNYIIDIGIKQFTHASLHGFLPNANGEFQTQLVLANNGYWVSCDSPYLQDNVHERYAEADLEVGMVYKNRTASYIYLGKDGDLDVFVTNKPFATKTVSIDYTAFTNDRIVACMDGKICDISLKLNAYTAIYGLYSGSGQCSTEAMGFRFKLEVDGVDTYFGEIKKVPKKKRPKISSSGVYVRPEVLKFCIGLWKGTCNIKSNSKKITIDVTYESPLD